MPAAQAPSWSSTDYGGHWKLLHYAAKRFFNPLLISADYNKSHQHRLRLPHLRHQPGPLRCAPGTEAASASVNTLAPAVLLQEAALLTATFLMPYVSLKMLHKGC